MYIDYPSVSVRDCLLYANTLSSAVIPNWFQSDLQSKSQITLKNMITLILHYIINVITIN